MRIIVFSDSHSRYFKLKRVVEAHPNADYYIHLGDGCGDVERLQAEFPDLPLLTVPGNCDTHQTPVAHKILKVEGKTILYRLSDDHVRSIVAQGFEHLIEERNCCHEKDI